MNSINYVSPLSLANEKKNNFKQRDLSKINLFLLNFIAIFNFIAIKVF